MKPSLFISDLHLHETRPTTSDAFFHFLDTAARGAECLYILGDLFEYWVGDDQIEHDSLSKKVCSALRGVSDAGVRVFFMRGNRDFLVGEKFAEAAGLTLLDDPTVVTLGSKRVLLLHGDTLCTDDISYQQFRAQARSPAWQQSILSKTYAERVALAADIRERSTTEKASKPDDIMDVSPATVDQVFRDHGYIDMIHGHTHRPALHTHVVDGHRCTRTVLADWHQDSVHLALEAKSK